jgi:hypothetical protein
MITPAIATTMRLNRAHLAHLRYSNEETCIKISEYYSIIRFPGILNYALDHDLTINFTLFNLQSSFFIKAPDGPDNGFYP